MAKKLKIIGSPLGIQFQLNWPDRRAFHNPESASFGRLSLWVGEHRIWGSENEDGSEEPVKWSWIELLEFLSGAWPYLCYESGYPLGLQPTRPARLRDEAEKRWQAVSDDRIDEEQEELFAFEETHDLSRGLHGLFVPSVWIIRTGNLAVIGTRKVTIRRPLSETLQTLEELGNSIYARIAALDDDRSREAAKSWADRLKLDMWSLAEIATRWTSEELRLATGSEDAELAFDLEGDAFRMTERLEIAGLTRGLLDTQQLRVVFQLLDALGPIETPELDDLSSEAEGLLEVVADPRRPYNEGYAIANWLRDKPGITDDEGRVNIRGVIESLRVHLNEVDLGTDLLDAVASWGPKHGPAVWLNLNQKHTDIEGAKRSTLAHELCHLLVDRSGALPLADAVNGNAPRWVEQRADAFAAELLLPRRLAASALTEDTNMEEQVEYLAKRYGVSWELTAWQIYNSGAALTPASFALLRSMVSRPENFLPR